MKQQNEPSQIIADYKRDQNFKSKSGFTKKWPEYTRFKEGDQWPKDAVKKWKNFTFLTINQCDFIVENKKSNILSQLFKLVFTPKEVPENMDKQLEQKLNEQAENFTNLAENTWFDIDQDQLNEDAVDDALTIGTGVTHYYFDDKYASGKYVQTKGRLCGHNVDPMELALGNPQLKPSDIQKQPYIIIKTYELTDQVKEYAKKHGKDHETITSDVDNDEEYDNGKNDLDSPNKTQCWTKYFKENGGVYWTKVTSGSTVQKVRPLSPTSRPFKLYPIDVLVFKPRKKSAYGRSALEDVINVQKGINFIYSMMAFGVQRTAWPKILVKAGALMQGITNEPGEVITDHDSSNPGASIAYMQPPNFSNMPPLLIDKLSEAMRQTTNTGDVMAGEALGANMAASAIIALQNQAKKPTEAYVKQLKRSLKRTGAIYEEFFKCYFIFPKAIVSETSEGKLRSKVITPSDYADTEFSMAIDVGASGEYSEQI